MALLAIHTKINHEVDETNVDWLIINCSDKGLSGSECGNKNEDLSGHNQKRSILIYMLGLDESIQSKSLNGSKLTEAI